MLPLPRCPCILRARCAERKGCRTRSGLLILAGRPELAGRSSVGSVAAGLLRARRGHRRVLDRIWGVGPPAVLLTCFSIFFARALPVEGVRSGPNISPSCLPGAALRIRDCLCTLGSRGCAAMRRRRERRTGRRGGGGRVLVVRLLDSILLMAVRVPLGGLRNGGDDEVWLRMSELEGRFSQRV